MTSNSLTEPSGRVDSFVKLYVKLYNSNKKALEVGTIKDVAREAGVSTATVSRVLSSKDPVSDHLRERVLSAVKRLGYRPNALARSLRKESTKTIGLLVSNVMNPFFAAVARAAEDTLRERGYSLILGNADEDPLKEEFYLEVLLEKRVDGLIVSPARAQSPHLEEIVREGIPLVFVDRSINGIDAPVARVDGKRAVEDLVEYLVGLGHRKLAIISGPPETISGKERLTAFLQSAERRGVAVAEQYVRFGDFRRPSGVEAMRSLLGLEEPPTAVFVSNNLMALGALQTIKSAGLRIPQSISLAIFDDVSWFELMEPPITAVTQPMSELGVAAARMLLEMVEKGQQPESLTMEANLVIRGSCSPPGW
jgi:LacI family transcriptional regulator